MNSLRWIFVFPVALLFGYLAYLVGGFINNLTIALFFGPVEGWVEMVSNFMNHMYLGLAFVLSAVWVAPSGRRYVAFAAFMLIAVFMGGSLYSSFEIGKFYALPSIAGALFGSFAGLFVGLSGWPQVTSQRK